MFFTKEKSFIRKLVACLIVIAMFVSSYCAPFSEIVKTAYAAEVEEGSPEETPTPSDDPVEVPTPSEGTETTDTPDGQEETPEVETQKLLLSLESLLDENGYLSDDGLLMLQTPPCDIEKYIEVTDKGNGLKAMKLYTEPIKFKNEEGAYELINNNIVTGDLENKTEYTNLASDIEITMSENLGQSAAIEMSFNGYSIGFSPLGILNNEDKNRNTPNFIVSEKMPNIELKAGAIEKNELVNDDKQLSETIDEVYQESKEYESILYTDTFNENTDIQITPTSTGLKEDIILYDIPRETEFSYEFTVTNVVPILRQDGNLYFVDIDKSLIVATIAAPYMYDSAEEEFSESYDIGVQLEKVSDNTYKYTLIPDRQFLKDEKTVYPVIIDPAVNTPTSLIADSFTTSRYSGNNYVNDSDLKIGYGSDLRISRGLVKLNQFPFGPGYTITYALYCAYQNYSGSSTPTIQLARITNDWNPYTVTWSNQPGLGEVYSQQTVQAIQWYYWDITGLVRGWYEGYIPNYGMYVKSSDENSNKYKRFSSSNSATNPNYFYIEYYDYSAPTGPSVWTSPNAANAWTNYTSYPILNWSGISDTGSGLSYVQYNIDGVNWAYAGTGSAGSVQVNVGTSGAHVIYVRGVDNMGNGGQVGSVVYRLDAAAPNTPAQPSITKTDGALNSKNSAQIKITFNAVADNPSGKGYASYYDVLMLKDGVETVVFDNVGAGTYTLNNQEDNKTYSFRIRAFDEFGYNSTSGYTTITTEDRTGPDITDASNVSINTSGWTRNTNPTITWGTISDEGGGTTVLKYQIDSTSGTWQTLGNYSAHTGTINCSSLADGTHTIYVQAYDAKGNSGAIKALTYQKDTIIPYAQIIMPDNEDVVPIPGNSLYYIEAAASDLHLASWTIDYALGKNPSESDFTDHNIAKGTATLESTNKKTWDLSNLDDNRLYTLRLKAVDQAGNIKEVRTVVLYALDTDEVSPQMTLRVLNVDSNEIINQNSSIEVSNVGVTVETEIEGLVSNKLFANDKLINSNAYDDLLAFNPLEYDEENNKWVYPEGSQVFLRMMSQGVNGEYYFTSTTYEGHKIKDSFKDISGLSELSHAALNSSGAIVPTDIPSGQGTSYIISNVQEINGLINYVTLTVNEDIPDDAEIEYYLIYDGGQRQIYPNAKTELNIPTNDFSLKAVFDASEPGSFPSLNSWYLDVMYIAFGDSTVINNSFLDNARGFENLIDVVHDEANEGCIKLDGYAEYPTYTYKTAGSVQSTVRNTPGDVWEAFLSVDESKPEGTDINYEISVDGGIHWKSITPGTDVNQEDQWLLIEDEGHEVILKAELSGDGADTPLLNSWNLKCRQTLAGNAYDIQLIDEPDNLSTLVDANYMTLLRWEPSETEGVTYHIYRSETPYFSTPESTLVGTTPNNYFYDYNLKFSTKFYYKVTAVKEFTGSDGTLHERESLPSNEAWAHTVSEKELNEKLGLQDYWSYSGFATGGGIGYVNVTNGNLVYKSTDLVVSDPFLASVMSRTYNSIAGTKTPMGYGWDYSFNTCLLKVYDETGVNVVALVLKDGDGSFHKFDYDLETETYSDAKGTFMELSEVRNASDELTGYEIKRKDDITYHFDASTMKLTKFTNNNGTALTFLYDYDIDGGEDGIPDTTDRGNLIEIVNSVGEKVILSYYVEGSEPEQGDYIYVNENIDMLASVTWTEDTASTPETITYTYNYNEDDQLESINAIINEESVCMQTFHYNADIDGDTQTADYNVVITDAEDRITVVSTNFYGKVSIVYDPIMFASDDTDPVLNEYLRDNYVFAISDTNSDGFNDSTTVTNSRGVSIGYTYDKNGLLDTKTDAAGNSILYTHNDDYLVTSMGYDNTISGTTKTIKHIYRYNTDGNIELIKTYSKNEGASDFTALEPQTQYTYYANLPNKIDTMTVKKDDVHSVVTKYIYDANGNVLNTTVADGSADSDGHSIEKTTQYSYYASSESDGMQWQLKSVEDEFGNEARYVYDNKGRLISQKQYDASNNYVRTVATYTYDGFSRTDTVAQPYVENETSSPLVANMEYDELGRLVQRINVDGTAEKWEYDLTSRLLTDTVGYMDGSEFIEENKTTYVYDLLGRLISSKIGNDPTTTDDDAASTIVYGYWDSTSAVDGNDADKITKTDAMGTRTIEYYDILGRLIETKVSDGSSTITTSKYTYDNIGNVIHAVDNAGTVTKVNYDEFNQQVRTVVDPFDSSDGKANLNVETLYAYDYLGNATDVTQVVYESEANQANPQRILTRYTYDDLSRLVKVTQNNPNFGQPGQPQYIETKYYYDKVTTVGSDTLIKNYTQDALGFISETYFDELGRTAIAFNKGDTSDGDDANGEYQKTTYTHDDALFLTETVTRTDGTKEAYTYDEVGRVQRIDYLESGASISSEYIEYEYDELGQVLTESSTTGSVTHSTSYRYDRMGRTTSVWEGTYTDNGAPDKVSDGLDIEYTYNDVGQVKNINYNTSTGTEHNLVYIYDGYGRISEIRLDPTEGDDNTVRQYQYDLQTGVLLYTRDYREFATVSAVLGDYIQTDYAYNSAGLVNEIKYSDADFSDANNTPGVTEKYTIAYDGRGQIVKERQDTDYSTDLATATKTLYKAYEYDSLGRLIKAGNGDNEASSWDAWDSHNTYTYDLDGNRKSMDNGTDVFSYDYNQFNQLTNVLKTNKQTQETVVYQTYRYDLRGNQTQEVTKEYLSVTVDDVTTKYDQTTAYIYNLRNQMTGTTISTPVANESTGEVTWGAKRPHISTTRASSA